MAEQKIEAHKVTKPIQLLAAWLVGLIIIESIFLTAAATITKPDWATGALVISAILYVPVFLILIFLLQTKYRPEMQEDTFYSKHLDKKTNIVRETPRLTKQEMKLAEIEELQRKLMLFMEGIANKIPAKKDANASHSLSWSTVKVAVNDMLPNYKVIRATLKREKIPVASIYGSSNPEPYAPEKYIVSLSDSLSMPQIQLLLLNLKETGVEGFNIFDEQSEEDNVYIGSYDIEVHSVLDDEFWQLLREESLDEVDFITMKEVKTIKIRTSK